MASRLILRGSTTSGVNARSLGTSLVGLILSSVALSSFASGVWDDQVFLNRVRELSGCTDQQWVAPEGMAAVPGVAYAAWVFNCSTEVLHLLAWSKDSPDPFELDRAHLNSGAIYSELREVGKRGTVLISTLSHEHDEFADVFYLKAYDLTRRKKLLSAWSSAPPWIEIAKEDSAVEIVIFKNVFGLPLSTAAGWPIVIRLGAEISVANAEQTEEILRRVLELTNRELRTIAREESAFQGHAKQVWSSGDLPTLYRDALRRQRDALTNVLGARKLPGE